MIIYLTTWLGQSPPLLFLRAKRHLGKKPELEKDLSGHYSPSLSQLSYHILNCPYAGVRHPCKIWNGWDVCVWVVKWVKSSWEGEGGKNQLQNMRKLQKTTLQCKQLCDHNHVFLSRGVSLESRVCLLISTLAIISAYESPEDTVIYL